MIFTPRITYRSQKICNARISCGRSLHSRESFSLFISTSASHQHVTPHLHLPNPSSNILTAMYRSDKLVSSTLISSLSLHNPLPRWAHAYVLPFIPLYPIFGAVWSFKYDEYIGSEEWTFVYLGTIITLNALTWLFVQWSVTFEALFTATNVHPPYFSDWRG